MRYSCKQCHLCALEEPSPSLRPSVRPSVRSGAAAEAPSSLSRLPCLGEERRSSAVRACVDHACVLPPRGLRNFAGIVNATSVSSHRRAPRYSYLCHLPAYLPPAAAAVGPLFFHSHSLPCQTDADARRASARDRPCAETMPG